MSRDFLTCFQDAIDAGLINAQKGADAKEVYTENINSGKTEAEAAAEAVDYLGRYTDKQRTEKIAAIRRTADLIDMFSKSTAPNETVEKLGEQFWVKYESNRKIIQAAGASFLVNSKRNIFGVAPANKLENMIDESFGIDTGDKAARELLDAAVAMENAGVGLVNRNGASMRPNESKRFPVRPSNKKIYEAKRARARQLMKEGVDPTEAGKRAFNEVREEYIGMLRRHYDWDEAQRDVPIVTKQQREAHLSTLFEIHASAGNWLKGPKVTVQESVAGRLNRNHGVYLKTADAWKEFNERWGEGDVFSQIISHVELLARDAALMHVFTPHAFNGKEIIKNLALKQASALDRHGYNRRTNTGKTTDANATLDAGFDIFTHNVNMGYENWGAQTVATLRNVGGMGVLGAAAISNFGDATFGFLGKHEAGLPLSSWMGSYFKAIKEGATKEGQISMIQSAGGAEAYASQTLVFDRFQGFFDGPQWTKRMGDSFFRITGLIPYTQRLEWAWAHDMHHGFGMMSKTEWGAKYKDSDGVEHDVSQFWKALEQSDITKEDWDAFRTTEIYTKGAGDHGESVHLRPIDMINRTDIDGTAVGEKFLDHITRLQRLAVPKVGFKEAAHLGQAIDRNLMSGMASQLFSAVKGFSTVMLFTHFNWVFRGTNLRDWNSSKAMLSRLGLMVFATTLAGAFITQVKEMLVRGRDPLPMNSPWFWSRAFLNGGSMGLLGDAFFSHTASYRGAGLADVFSGPIVDQVNNFHKLTLGNIQKWEDGKKTSVGKDLVKFAEGILPVPWEAQLILDRMLFETVLNKLDPVAHRRMLSRTKQLETERSQDSWWRRGALAPEGVPDLRNLFRQQE